VALVADPEFQREFNHVTQNLPTVVRVPIVFLLNLQTLDNDPVLLDMDCHALGLFPQPFDVFTAMEDNRSGIPEGVQPRHSEPSDRCPCANRILIEYGLGIFWNSGSATKATTKNLTNNPSLW
jgi:hypothetical protein